MRCQPWVAALEARTLLSTLTVTNDNDSGSGSLRGALAVAVAGDTIKFARSAYGTITLSSGPLQVASSVTIDGPGAKDITINGNNSFQDLMVDANITATISGLTVTGGQGPATYPYGGGGIFNDGTLTVANCVITSNSGEVGGGILNSGSLTVESSVVSNNTATLGGAGIQNNPTAVLEINGSTIANNAAGDLDGGIGNFGGTVKITNSVVSGNSAPSGGGGIGDTRFSGGGGTMTIDNSLISNNSASSENGGGILVNGGALTLSLSTVENNPGSSFEAPPRSICRTACSRTIVRSAGPAAAGHSAAASISSVAP